YQLFDMKKDPHEMNDLYPSEKYQPIVRQMKKKLVNFLRYREEGFVVDEELVPVELSKITPTLTKTGDSQS
ncbi:sulfatase/phosphatase domain-containing protein, partial [Streptococcus pneumoniae]